jgi:hypothetical protein
VIPISSKNEFVEYTDSDGVVFKFRPKTPALEREWVTWSKIASQADTDTQKSIDATRDFVNKILVGWSGDNTPPVPTEPASIWVIEELSQLIEFWGNANTLSKEQKKS